MTIKYHGQTFSGYNKPKRTPGHPKKSHVVLAKDNGEVKLIRFGQQGVSGAGKHPATEAEKARRRSFKARHAKNIAKGKMSAAYWADKVKW
jgi:predicted ATP-dependent Lon-type protease